MKTLLAGALLLALALAGSSALAAIDFEQPTYVIAQVAGQDGWTTTWDAVWWVTTPPIAGDQSLHVDWYSYAFRSIAGETFADGTKASILTKTQDAGVAGKPSQSMFWLNNASGATYAATWINADRKIYVLNAAGNAWVNTGHTYADLDLLEVTYTLNFTTQTFDLTVNNLTNPAGSFTSTGLGFSAPVTAGNAAGKIQLGGQFAWFDNLQVTAVPEPASLLALAAGLTGLAGIALRRRA